MLTPTIITVYNGRAPYDIEVRLTTRKNADRHFMKQCRSLVPNFAKKYNKEDVEDILDDGYFEFDRGYVAIVWATKFKG